MQIPGWLLRHTVTVRTRTGSGPYGDVFAAPVEVRCLVDDRRTLVRDSTGEQVVSSATVYAQPDQAATLATGSRVTVNGRETTVIKAHRAEGGGLPTPDHVAASLA